MSSLVLHPRSSRPSTVLQRSLIYAAVTAAFAMVIGVSLGLGHAQPPANVASSHTDQRPSVTTPGGHKVTAAQRPPVVIPASAGVQTDTRRLMVDPRFQ